MKHLTQVRTIYFDSTKLLRILAEAGYDLEGANPGDCMLTSIGENEDGAETETPIHAFKLEVIHRLERI